MARSALLNVMTQAAMKAGRSLTRDFGEVQNLQVSMKGPADFVATADRKAEEIVFSELTRARPDWGFISARRGVIEGRDPQHRWIVETLDGATNFLHGLPVFAVSLAVERDGQIVAGIVFNPVQDELYAAEKGTGAFLNDRRLRVAARTRIHDAVLATGMPSLGQGDQARYLFEMRRFTSEAAGIRHLGCTSLDLAYTAAGRFDAFWDRGLKPWSLAAGSLLVREAGGFVTRADGGRFEFMQGEIVCANELMHKALVAELALADNAYRAGSRSAPAKPAEAKA